LQEARTLIAFAIEFHIRGLRQAGDDVPQPVSLAEDVEVAA